MGCRAPETYRPPRLPLGGVHFMAAAEVTGASADTLMVQVTARNTSRTSRVLEYGSCRSVRVCILPPGGGPARWDYRAWRDQTAPSLGWLCAGGLYSAPLAPGIR